MKHLIAFAAALLIVTSLAAQDKKGKAPAPPPPNVMYEQDIVYGKGGETELHLDFARPETASGRLPCIIVIHGGGWRAGNFKQLMCPRLSTLPNRVSRRRPCSIAWSPMAQWPVKIEDVKCAVRYLRATANQIWASINTALARSAFSAGPICRCCSALWTRKTASKATAAATNESSKVQAVVIFFGPTDLAADFPITSTR